MPVSLLHGYRHAAQAERSLKTDCRSAHPYDDAVRIPQRGHSRTAYYRERCRALRIRTDDVGGGPEIGRGANQVHRRRANGPYVDAADAQSISPTLEIQGAGAAPKAHDETGLDDMEAYRAGRCVRLRQGADQHDRRRQNSRAKFR